MRLEKLRAARDRYLAQNSLDVSSYTAPTFPIYLAGWTLNLPNPGRLRLHDLHHVATGYGTGWIGEAEISAYELRGGCGSTMILALCLGAILCGMLIAPRRVLSAWRRAKRTRTLYGSTTAYDALLEMTVDELRAYLGFRSEETAERELGEQQPAAAIQ